MISGNTISYTTFRYSSADYGCDHDDGSEIEVTGENADDTLIDGNTIEHNVAHCGDGIRVGYYVVPKIVNNRILHNPTLARDGGGIDLFNVYQDYIVPNIIAGNVAADMGEGIGFSCVDPNAMPYNSGPINSYIVGNTIMPNTAISTDAAPDGSQVGFHGYTSQTGMYNNIIVSADFYAAVSCNPICAGI